MTSKSGWRENASLVLAGVLLVSLAFTFVGEAVDLLWLEQPAGTIAWNLADVFAWVFAVALIAEFVLVASMDDPTRRPHGTKPFRPGD